MLLSIRTTTSPVEDLSYLLHKHPDKIQEFDLTFGRASVFYPPNDEGACEVVLLVEVDPVGLVRSRRGPAGENGTLAQYVNDRPYVASSFLSVAIAEVFGSALAGRCKDRPAAIERLRAFSVSLPAVPCRQGRDLLQRLFAPLGYQVSAEPLALDSHFPEWGMSRYLSLRLEGEVTLRNLLSHLYVLLPVLDNNKHYWIGGDEVEKLLSKGEGWLATHPEKDLIAQRCLRYQRSLVDSALEQLIGDEPEERGQDEENEMEERALSLNEQRLGAVLGILKASGARRVIDLGCGEGRLIHLLQAEPQFEEILGMDVSNQALENAARLLRFDRMPEWQKKRLKLVQGSLIYRDERLAGFDAAALVEVIEHLDPSRLAALERSLFEFARPGTVVVTTPNREYNAKWPALSAETFRHHDHRFEWSRAEFQVWANAAAKKFGYSARFLPVGPEDDAVGSPTQMGVFARGE